MPTIDQNTYRDFLDRFNQLFDGVIRGARSSAGEGEMLVSTRDRNATEDDGWVNLRIHFDDVVEAVIDQQAVRDEYQIISDGCHVLFQDDVLYMDIAPHADAPDCVDDFRRSRCMIAARRCCFTVEQYAEDVREA
jgi:hypothetical protein